MRVDREIWIQMREGETTPRDYYCPLRMKGNKYTLWEMLMRVGICRSYQWKIKVHQVIPWCNELWQFFQWGNNPPCGICVRVVGGIGMGEEDEGPTDSCTCTGGLGMIYVWGLGMGLGCTSDGFGGDNINTNVNDNIIIREAASNSSLLGHIQSGSGTSNLLLLRCDEWE